VIRTLVCAASELARIGLASVVRGDARLVLAGEVAPHELERRVAEIDPDVVLEQYDFSGGVRRSGTVALVDDPGGAWASGGHASDDDPGAHAILARDAAPHEIAAAIVAVAAGLVAVQPRTLARAGSPPVTAGASAATGASAAGFGSESLTSRERDVLSELARGAPNKAIAARLSISEHTVKFHIGSIFTKLGVSSRTEAVTQGVRRGLVML